MNEAAPVSVKAHWIKSHESPTFVVWQLRVGVLSLATVTLKTKSSQLIKRIAEDGHEIEEWTPQAKPTWHWSVCSQKREEFNAVDLDSAIASATAVLEADDLDVALQGYNAHGFSPTPMMPYRAIFGVDKERDFKKGVRIHKKDGMP